MKDNKPTRSSRKSGSVSVENDNSDRDAVKEAEVKDEAANMSASSPNGSQAGNGIEEKPRLSEGEKKANHIASEQKRRQAIREGFDRLTELVPGLEGQGRSESVVLKKTVDYMRLQLEERRRLVAQIEAMGGPVEEDYRK